MLKWEKVVESQTQDLKDEKSERQILHDRDF